MNPEDFKSFGVFMSVLQETFSPDKPISKERTKIYFESLKDIPIANIELGIKELMRKKRYSIFPLPVEIREAAGFVEEDDLELSALSAFREACDLVHYFALEKELHPKDPYVNEAIYLCFGGWENFTRTDSKNDAWDKKHFVEVYKRLLASDKREKLLSQAEILKQIQGNRKKMKTLEEKK
ncbi:unnamed protein product [marine sediment metagenome]|uniref:Replicative helicase inhibitor G39P N-terminal domain-containing protein n=1 Tax=marine sediment metagenome TaxID=412755 RepID=X1EXB7_9ZZZZ